jgi:hypothetical protein
LGDRAGERRGDHAGRYGRGAGQRRRDRRGGALQQPERRDLRRRGQPVVADTNNHTIRQLVLATGAVTTVAGLPGTYGATDGSGNAARFNQPLTLASDRAGKLYVADTLNSAVRKVVPATGAVSTYVGVLGLGKVGRGPLPATISFPVGIALTSTGDLVVTSREDAVLIVRAPLSI